VRKNDRKKKKKKPQDEDIMVCPFHRAIIIIKTKL